MRWPIGQFQFTLVYADIGRHPTEPLAEIRTLDFRRARCWLHPLLDRLDPLRGGAWRRSGKNDRLVGETLVDPNLDPRRFRSPCGLGNGLGVEEAAVGEVGFEGVVEVFR